VAGSGLRGLDKSSKPRAASTGIDGSGSVIPLPGGSLRSDAIRRQLYNAFCDEPDGVAGYVLAQRLEACRRDIEDRRLDATSITELAMRRGFNHPAHFSRAFKARFGVTPSECRAQRRIVTT